MSGDQLEPTPVHAPLGRSSFFNMAPFFLFTSSILLKYLQQLLLQVQAIILLSGQENNFLLILTKTILRKIKIYTSEIT